MLGKIGVLLCCIGAAAAARADTVLIDGGASPAIVVLPASVPVTMKARRVVVETDGAGHGGSAVRLSGDASIKLHGQRRPLLIRGQDVLLRRQPDSRAAAQSSRSDRLIAIDGDTRAFIGHVVYNGETSDGPFQIKADRVEYRNGPAL